MASEPAGVLFHRRRAGELVDLAPGRHLDVPLHWQQWNLRSSLIDAVGEDGTPVVEHEPDDRIAAVQTGGCPHTAIREDTSMNEAAIEQLKARFPDLQVIFVESGGDNLSATFSPELVDFSIYIIDVAQGEKIPRKAGQGMIKSDLFIVNKTDLAPYVGADLSVMESDSKVFRKDRPFAFTNLKTDEGLDVVMDWIRNDVLMADLG